MKLVTKENLTKIIGFAAACMVTFLVTVGISMPTWAKVAAVAVGGILGCYFVSGNEKQIVSYGTGFVGAVMICKGIGSYAGGFPAISNAADIEDLKVGYAFIGYIVGIIVLTIAGGMI